jgi:hypothetical protein
MRDLISIFQLRPLLVLTWSVTLGIRVLLESAADLPMLAQEQLAEMKEDCTLRMTFQDMTLDTFWISFEKE